MERGEGLVLCHGHNLEIQELEAKLRELEKKNFIQNLDATRGISPTRNGREASQSIS